MCTPDRADFSIKRERVVNKISYLRLARVARGLRASAILKIGATCSSSVLSGAGEKRIAEEITTLLEAARQGDSTAADALFNKVYRELRTIAKSHRRRWVGNHTLNTTALIHEAFIKLDGNRAWESRTHFYATAAKAMRHVLINYAEKKNTAKRGSGIAAAPLDDILVPTDDAVEDALMMHQALERMEKEQPRWCHIVECRFFGGMTIEETASALDTSTATVSREWKLASAWLARELQGPADEAAGR